MRSPGYRDIERLETEFHALTEIAKTLTSPLDLRELLSAVLEKISAVLPPAETGIIMLWDQPAGLFRPEAAFGYNLEMLRNVGLRAGESITGKVFDGGRPILFGNPQEIASAMADMRAANRTAMIQSLQTEALPHCCLAAPLIATDQKYGVIVLETFQTRSNFTENDLPFVQVLADLIALAIDRARLAARADAIREEHRAERMRSEVLATLSHELRMPLTAIQGYSSALLMEEVDWSNEKRREFLRLIEDECINLQTMLKDILDSSLIDVDQFIINRQPARIPFIAREIAEEFQRRTESHRIIVDFAATFPILEIDTRWIKQVFRNILDNAIKYSPEGGLIVIRGEVRACDVVIVVADQGIGISPENLIPLFERYFRVHSKGTLHIPGTGLGLPIARAIVEAHGGRIWAESNLGEGTSIYFSLPNPYKAE